MSRKIFPDEHGNIPCRECGTPHPHASYKRGERSGIDRRCKECQRKRSLEYSQRPSSKQRSRERERARWRDPIKRARYAAYSKQYMTTERRMFQCARTRAKNQNLTFLITLQDIEVPERCPLLDLPLKPGIGKLHANSPSLDRIDPSRGYIPGNVWVISYRANAIKQDATPDELIKLARRLQARLAQR